MEYRRGILFVRLKGRFDNFKFSNVLNYYVDYFGINSIVLNLCELDYISLENVKYIIVEKDKILRKKKKILILDNKVRSSLFEKEGGIDNEIDAFSLI